MSFYHRKVGVFYGKLEILNREILLDTITDISVKKPEVAALNDYSSYWQKSVKPYLDDQEAKKRYTQPD